MEEVINLTQPYIRWEVPVLVLISLTSQVVLVLLSNRRRYSKSPLLNAVLWALYNGANAVATTTLSVISTNLAVIEALDSLDAQIDLQTFWAPFFLLHLGGPDTITALEMEDNDLWGRHMQVLVGQTGLTLYILFKAWRPSNLRALSAMMFTAGSIKLAERTWSLWSASYQKRREKAEKALNRYRDYVYLDRDPVDVRLMRNDGDMDVKSAIEMFHDTEGMFADVLVQRNLGYKRFVQEISSPKVMRLIEMELEMMYDNLYTKARVILSYTGLALRFTSFLLTCITLIMFSSSERRKHHFRDITEYSLTFLLFAVSIGLELYAAFVFLTLYRTISWFREHNMGGVARIMENLAKLRSQNWSNSMGQFSEISYFMQNKPKKTKGPLLTNGIFPRKSIMWLHVYPRPVPDRLKQFIHEYLKKASNSTNKCLQQQPLFVQGKGIVPWKQYILDDNVHVRIDPLSLENASSLFDKEFGEMIIFLHLVTEVCYYMDRSVFDDRGHEYEDIFQMSKVSKYLSRYLMHLFVVSWDLLPQRTPLSKMRFNEDLNPAWQPFLSPAWNDNAQRGGGGGEGEEQDEKKNRREFKVQACVRFWKRPYFIGNSSAISDLQFAHDLLKVMMPEHDLSPPQPQLKQRWEVLSVMWVEFLVHAADQCKGKAHAQHLRRGGELLTHVWVLLGHFGFIDEAFLPFKGHDDGPVELHDEIQRDQLSSPV